ncbi:tyrosine-type recombinase/integrase [Bifidobacterium panos]|nr:tyrosine-type recombinase/integrase [Bifidobacterium sp. DSM 109963]
MARTKDTFGSTEKTPSGKYRGTYANPIKGGKPARIKSPTFETKREAYAWLAEEKELVRLHRLGKQRWLPPKERRKKEEAEWVKQHQPFMPYAAKAVAEFSINKTEGTKRKLREALSHIDEMGFTHGTIAEITRENIETWYETKMNDKPSSKRRTYMLLKRILRKAINEGIINENPCVLPNPKVPQSKRQSVEPATGDQLRIIYQNMPEYTRIFVYVAAFCGLRINEVCALQLKDIDLKRKILHVRHSVGRGDHDRGERRLKETKTPTSSSDLVIPDPLVPLLEERMGRQPNDPESMLIESRAEGRRIISDNTVREHFETAARIAGRPDLTPHQLKALFTDTLINEGGLSPRETADAARHTSETINFIYQRDKATRQREGINKAMQTLMPRNAAQVEAEIREAEERLARLKTELAKMSHQAA